MADSLALIAVEKLTNVLHQQLTLFAGATHELERLKESFQSIQAVLRDAESRQVAEESARVWLSRLKHVAYDIEDVLDEGKISCLGEEGDYDEGDCRNKACQSYLSPYNCLDHVVSRSKVARRIKEIRERLDQIADDKNMCNFSSSAVGDDARSQRLTTSLIMESEVMIGRANDREIIISRLVSGGSYEEGGQVPVIAMVGMGGLGKTTLAKQIYHDRRVQNHFIEAVENHFNEAAQNHFNKALYWVCVSETFDVTRLTREIVEAVTGSSSSFLGLNSLQNDLLESLRGKRFLLVLDDVWNDDAEKWEKLGASLNSGAYGSRVLVTTRSNKVANTMKATYIHELEGLSDDQSWTLFSSRAFVGRNKEERSRLESVGRKIVNKCKGVPLSIKVIGSVMQSKRTVEDWENVLNSKAWSVPEVTHKILTPLSLTYSNLPTHLKQCFAYCSIFPKDWQFKKDMLVKLWGAQGFIRSQGHRETEDVGAEHFEELVAWSMFQEVVEVKHGLTSWKMHGLLHDLAEFVAKDDIYTFISIEGGKSKECPVSNVRHAFLSFTGSRYASTNRPFTLARPKKLRTLFLQGVDDENSKVLLSAIFQQARFLRAVVFENSVISRLPNAIGKMKHLRYLDLSGSRVVELPESVSHLRNLHSLNLSNCLLLEKLPRGIGGMVSLRHLEIEGTSSLNYLPKGLGRISGLRSLCKFIVGGGGEGVEGCRIDELQGLNSLHGSLEIENLDTVSSREEAEKAKLWNKPYLRRLVLCESGSIDDAEAERMDNVIEGLRPHIDLEELELKWFRGSRLSSWMDETPCLRKLEILYCELLESLPHSFGQLKALSHLDISYCDALRSLPDSLGQLESLQHLRISACDKLESLPHSFGQLKALNHLEISDCHALGSLPDGLQHLSLLQQLRIYGCPCLSERCKRDGGEDWPKISHIPDISIDYRRIR